MKAEDLMIGDYVYIKSSDGEDTHIVKVKTIEESGINQFNGFIEFRELEPIPLTDEILEKNGFKKNNFNQYMLGKSDLGEEIYFEIGFVQLRYPNSYYSILSCGYVHEFQHVLKIFGIKKTIEL